MAKIYLKKLSDLVNQVKLEVGSISNGKLEIKHFFSGAAVYVNGKICMSFTPSGLALKLPEEKRKILLQARKASVLRYFPKSSIKKDYVVLSEPLIKNLNELSYWMNLCIEYVTNISYTKKDG